MVRKVETKINKKEKIGRNSFSMRTTSQDLRVSSL